MKTVALFSGGKDSVYAAHYCMQQGYDVCSLLSMVSKNDESYMYHTLKIDRVPLIAEAIGIKLHCYETEGKKEEELDDLYCALEELKKIERVEGVISGALASDYQKRRIDGICEELSLASLAPLWHIDPKIYMRQLLEERFKVKIVGVFADGLDDGWVGRTIDLNLLDALEKLNIHVAGEGGEYETFVYDGPCYKHAVDISQI